MNPRNLMKSYLCAFCDDEFAQNSDVNDHISKVHAKEIGGIEDDLKQNQDELVKTYKHQRKSKPQSRLLPCDFCDREFILEETLCVVTVGVPLMKTSLAVSWQVISQILCT